MSAGASGATYGGSAYGLTFQVPFPCPALLPAEDSAVPDVTVVAGHVPRQLPSAAIRTNTFDAGPGRFLFRGGVRAGRFLVEDGARITFERNPAGDDRIIAFHFLHSVMAALLDQRGFLVLHASAALVGGGVTVVSGESGAGKSTVLAALGGRGFSMLSDDVTALRLQAGGEVDVMPGPQWIHLCDDAATRLSPGSAALPRESWHRMKVAVQTAAPVCTIPRPFKQWATLANGAGDTLRIGNLSGAAKLEALMACIYMPVFASEQKKMLGLLQAAMEQARVLTIERPAGKWTLDQVLEAFLNG